MTKTISFSFDVFNGNEIVAQETINYMVSEKELRQIASIMDDNGGHRVDLCALEGLKAALEEEIYVNRLQDIVPEDVNYENIFIQLQQDMPEDLVIAADEYVRMKTVDIVYYIWKEGTELKREGVFGISPREYNAMRKTAVSEADRETDFGLMKRLFPEEYLNVSSLVEEYAFKECMRDYGQGFPVSLKEFPYQVFSNL